MIETHEDLTSQLSAAELQKQTFPHQVEQAYVRADEAEKAMNLAEEKLAAGMKQVLQLTAELQGEQQARKEAEEKVEVAVIGAVRSRMEGEARLVRALEREEEGEEREAKLRELNTALEEIVRVLLAGQEEGSAEGGDEDVFQAEEDGEKIPEQPKAGGSDVMGRLWVLFYSSAAAWVVGYALVTGAQHAHTAQKRAMASEISDGSDKKAERKGERERERERHCSVVPL
eukprot:3573206-Rhodomonas_salina.1